jgi:hypothetical protein
MLPENEPDRQVIRHTNTVSHLSKNRECQLAKGQVRAALADDISAQGAFIH